MGLYWATQFSSSAVGVFFARIISCEHINLGSPSLAVSFILDISYKDRLFNTQVGNQGAPMKSRKRTANLYQEDPLTRLLQTYISR